MGSLVIVVSDEFGGSDLGYLGFKSSHLILSPLFFFSSLGVLLFFSASLFFFLFFTVFLIIFDHFLSCLFFLLAS